MTAPSEKREEPRKLGPNHRDDCDGMSWRYSGEGYNRVALCHCGAEDHAPESWVIAAALRTAEKLIASKEKPDAR